jgi:hypothetical protein
MAHTATLSQRQARGAIGIDLIDDLTGGGLGTFDVPCPLCGPLKRSLAKQRKRVLKVWRRDENFASFNCARCAEHGSSFDPHSKLPDPEKLAKVRAEAAEHEREIIKRRREKARWLWQQRRPIIGSIAERYLREARGYNGPLPATLGFLRPWRDYQPAVIAAFGLATELEPGGLAIADHAVLGVHLIKLLSDGSDRIRGDDDDAKVTIGRGFVAPIVLAPPNDLLALTIAEGVEDGLSDHQISGAGVWAAASAGRMPGLAALVPSYIESVTILVDDNEAGRSCSHALAAALHARDIEVLLAGAPS